jgi:hypothetical protein
VGSGRAEELNTDITMDFVELLQILQSNPTCDECQQVGTRYPQYISRGPGGVAVLQLGCLCCKRVIEVKTGSQLKLPEDCPFRNLEEARVVLQHFLARGSGAELSRRTSHMGPAGIPSTLYRECEFYMFSAMKETRDECQDRVLFCAANLEFGTLGHLLNLWACGDCRWHTRGRASIHGTYNYISRYWKGLPQIASEHMSKNVTDEEQRRVQLAPHTGTAPAMDRSGAVACNKTIKKKGGRVVRHTQDGDAATELALETVFGHQLAAQKDFERRQKKRAEIQKHTDSRAPRKKKAKSRRRVCWRRPMVAVCGGATKESKDGVVRQPHFRQHLKRSYQSDHRRRNQGEEDLQEGMPTQENQR